MKRKVWFFVALAIVSVHMGCNGGESPATPELPLKAFSDARLFSPIPDVGEFHNEVVLRYFELRNDEPITWATYVPTLTQSVNDVLSLRGEEVRIAESDIVASANAIRILAKSGILDVGNPTLEDLLGFVDHVALSQRLSVDEADQIKQFLAAAFDVAERGEPIAMDQLFADTRAHAVSDEVMAFLDIFEASLAISDDIIEDDGGGGGILDNLKKMLGGGVDASVGFLAKARLGTFAGGALGAGASIAFTEVVNHLGNLDGFGDTPPDCPLCPPCSYGPCFGPEDV